MSSYFPARFLLLLLLSRLAGGQNSRTCPVSSSLLLGVPSPKVDLPNLHA